MSGGNKKKGEALHLGEYNCSSAPRQFRDSMYSRQELHLLVSGEHRAQESSSKMAKSKASCRLPELYRHLSVD